MENLKYRFTGGRAVAPAPARLVGVVASGNLEVLIEQVPESGVCEVEISTAARGFAAIWEAVVSDFFVRQPLADVRISINDNGATPAVVALRLDQAVAEFLAGVREGAQ
jgi:malonate decarboxylase delta subunit